MNVVKIRKILFRFLKENKCYKQFMANYSNDRINFQNYSLNTYIILNNKNMSHIIDSFYWKNEYTLKIKNKSWAEINDEWIKIMKNNNYFSND